MRIRNILAGLGGACMLVLGQSPLLAAPYTADIAFQATGQSMWNQGSAGQLNFNHFIGPTWNEHLDVGGIFNAEIPAATIIPEVCAWGVCTPAVTTPAIDFGDFGGKITGDTDGAIGFDLNVTADTGSVNVAYPGTANFEFPDRADLVAGVGTFDVSTMFAEGMTAMDTNFPEASLTLDFVFDVFAAGGFEVCVVACGSLDFPTIDINERLSLLNIDSNTAEVSFDLGFVTIGAQLPNLDTADTNGTNGAGNLTSGGIGDNPLIDLDIDLDLIATTLLGLPALTQEVSLFGASAGFTLLDVLIGAEVKVLQSFVFDPTLMVRLDAADGQSVTGAVGSNLTFDTFRGGETAVTPTFFLQNNFRNTTSLRIDPTFDLELLSAHLGLDLPDIANTLGISDVNIMFGPVFETHQSVAGPDFNVFNKSWEIPFDPITTAAFIVSVPEPGSLALFGIGLLLLGVSSSAAGSAARRRQRADGLPLAA